jgi:hypothetical protein
MDGSDFCSAAMDIGNSKTAFINFKEFFLMFYCSLSELMNATPH